MLQFVVVEAWAACTGQEVSSQNFRGPQLHKCNTAYYKPASSVGQQVRTLLFLQLCTADPVWLSFFCRFPPVLSLSVVVLHDDP